MRTTRITAGALTVAATVASMTTLAIAPAEAAVTRNFYVVTDSRPTFPPSNASGTVTFNTAHKATVKHTMYAGGDGAKLHIRWGYYGEGTMTLRPGEKTIAPGPERQKTTRTTVITDNVARIDVVLVCIDAWPTDDCDYLHVAN